MYECDCCERNNVPQKLKGIGYLCDDCFPSWVWDHPYAPLPLECQPDHLAGRACPFKVPL